MSMVTHIIYNVYIYIYVLHIYIYIYVAVAVYVCLCLRTENRSRKTHVFEYRDCGLGWDGVGWGGMLTFLLLRT